MGVVFGVIAWNFGCLFWHCSVVLLLRILLWSRVLSILLLLGCIVCLFVISVCHDVEEEK